MFIIPLPPPIAGNASLRPSSIGRELAPRTDRPPTDDVVDLPEIQQPDRVSFSDEARILAAGSPRDESPRQLATTIETRWRHALDAYRQIAAL